MQIEHVRREIFAEEPGGMTDFFMMHDGASQPPQFVVIRVESIPEFLHPHAHIHLENSSDGASGF